MLLLLYVMLLHCKIRNVAVINDATATVSNVAISSATAAVSNVLHTY